ncbi:MAG: SUMF1/EgtB/PvdO family nonheme iron enzyme, partial [Myxococcota bacterium]
IRGVARGVAASSPRRWAVSVAAIGLCACGEPTSPPAPGGPTATASAPAVPVSAPPGTAAQIPGRAGAAGQRVEVPAGSFTAGSTPGDEGRHPTFEPPRVAFTLGAFGIARLPYPNDPSLPPRTGVTRDEAAKLCAARSGRLCTDLEWERACQGPDGDRYAGGEQWSPECGLDPARCASGFDVLAMGGGLREWTSSEVPRIKGVVKRDAPVIKGAGPGARDVDHRCARRDVAAADTSAPDLGFRCCFGEAPDVVIAAPDWEPTMTRIDFPPTRLADLFRADPKLAPLAAGEIKYFNEAAARATVLRRAAARGATEAWPEGTETTTAPVVWNPAPGETILLVTGVSGDDSFIVAYHRAPDGNHRLGAAMLMENELGPVVFVYDKYRRRQLQWTTCLDCYGDTGNITYREENRVAITQR